MLTIEESKVKSHWKKFGSENLISVKCLTFNHEFNIERCLDSILSQVTEYHFEIVIHDDCSTDNTQKIICDYQQKYPSIIKPILQSANTYSQNPILPGLTALKACSGNYVAICEGDDYWVDTKKLEKQVLFLKENPSYTLTVSGYYEYDTSCGKNNTILLSPATSQKNEKGFTFTLNDIRHRWYYSTLTAFFVLSPDLIKKLEKYKYLRDVHLLYHLLKTGDGFYFSEIFGTYNIHSSGVFSGISKLRKSEEHYLLYKEMWEMDKDDVLRYIYFRVYLKHIVNVLKFNFNFSSFKWALMNIPSSLSLIRGIKDFLYMVYLFLPKIEKNT